MTDFWKVIYENVKKKKKKKNIHFTTNVSIYHRHFEVL